MKLKALRTKVLVTEMEKGERKLSSGIIIPNDDGKEYGVRPRWVKVYSVGEDVVGLKEGQWLLVEHGRWSRGIELREGDEKLVLFQIDWPDCALMISDEPPVEFAERY